MIQYHSLFPTQLVVDSDPGLAEKLLSICDYYVSRSSTNLLQQPNFPSTLYDENTTDRVNSDKIVVDALDHIHDFYIRDIMQSRGLEYKRELFGPPFGFFSSMKKGALLRKHSHQDCHFSGIIFLEVGKDVPPLTFHDPRPAPKFQTEGFKTKDTIDIWPEEGMIMIWDHWLEHEIMREHYSDDPRKVFSFNI